jgi:anaerobic ribonucleoside-triphosphate reductase activating protein
MLKYTESKVTFAEIPTEINLCLSISNCSGTCEGCHSPELREDIGKDLYDNIGDEIVKHKGITCVCLLGEGRKSPTFLTDLIVFTTKMRLFYPHLKLALYSGRPLIENELMKRFDYVKLGPYIASRGPLDNPNTNQKLLKINKDGTTEDITYLFWRKINENKN